MNQARYGQIEQARQDAYEAGVQQALKESSWFSRRLGMAEDPMAASEARMQAAQAATDKAYATDPKLAPFKEDFAHYNQMSRPELAQAQAVQRGMIASFDPAIRQRTAQIASMAPAGPPASSASYAERMLAAQQAADRVQPPAAVAAKAPAAPAPAAPAPVAKAPTPAAPAKPATSTVAAAPACPTCGKVAGVKRADKLTGQFWGSQVPSLMSAAFVPYAPVAGWADSVGGVSGLFNGYTDSNAAAAARKARAVTSVIPGVGGYRVGQRKGMVAAESKRRGAKSPAANLVAEELGPATSLFAATAAGGLAGAGIGAQVAGLNNRLTTGDGAFYGGLIGAGVGVAGTGIASLVGIIRAAVAERRTLKEQAEHDTSDSVLSKYLVPGTATFASFKRLGASRNLIEDKEKKAMNSDQRVKKALEDIGIRVPESKVDGEVPASDDKKHDGRTVAAPDPAPNVKTDEDPQTKTTEDAPDAKLAAAYWEGVARAEQERGVKLAQVPGAPEETTGGAVGTMAAEDKAQENAEQSHNRPLAHPTSWAKNTAMPWAQNTALPWMKNMYNKLPGEQTFGSVGKGLAWGAGALGSMWLLRKLMSRRRKQAAADPQMQAYMNGFMQACAARGIDGDALLEKGAQELAQLDPDFAIVYKQAWTNPMTGFQRPSEPEQRISGVPPVPSATAKLVMQAKGLLARGKGWVGQNPGTAIAGAAGVGAATMYLMQLRKKKQQEEAAEGLATA